MNRNQLQRLEKNIRCMNYKHLFHNYWIADDLKLKGILWKIIFFNKTAQKCFPSFMSTIKITRKMYIRLSSPSMRKSQNTDELFSAKLYVGSFGFSFSRFHD